MLHSGFATKCARGRECEFKFDDKLTKKMHRSVHCLDINKLVVMAKNIDESTLFSENFINFGKDHLNKQITRSRHRYK